MGETPFNCIYCSSEEINRPFNNLFNSSSTEWISAPNPKYPIKAVINFKGTFILDGMQIVSHESMIATRIGIYNSNNPNLNNEEINSNNFYEYQNKFNWKSIGYFEFSSNERSNWVAREFKKVFFPKTQVSFLMLVISECYRKVPKNYYKQVSIISLKFLGTHLYRPRFGSSLAEMFDDLIKAKKNAIENENFSLAEIINVQIENTKINKDALNSLFARKQLALEKEEFLTVDLIISKIFSIINQPIQNQQFQNQPIRNQPIRNQQIQSPQIPQESAFAQQSNKDDEEINSALNESEDLPTSEINETKKENSINAKKNENKERDIKITNKSKAKNKTRQKAHENEEEESSSNEEEDEKSDDKEEEEKEEEDEENDEDDKEEKEEEDDKDEKEEEDNDDDDDEDDDDDDSKSSKKVKKPSKRKAAKSDSNKPKSDNGELPGDDSVTNKKKNEVSPLSDEALREAEYLIELFGDEPVAMIYSDNWETKTKGLSDLCDKIKQHSDKKAQNDALHSMFPVVHKLFMSNHKTVYCQTVDQIISLIDEMSENGVFGENGGFPKNMIHQLLSLSYSKLGNTNNRLSEASMKFTKWAAKNDKALLNEIVQFTLKQPSSKQLATPQMNKNKLDLLNYLIEENESALTSKIKVNDLMAFILKSLESPNKEVRAKAVVLYTTSYCYYGTKVEKFIEDLPKTIKNELLTATGVKS